MHILEATLTEGRFYEKLSEQAVTCTLCEHGCLLKDGAVGLCNSRINRNGTLLTATYGSIQAYAVDPVEKKPLYHFFPGSTTYSIATAGCSFSCEFCQNADLVAADHDLVSVTTPDEIIRNALLHNVNSIAYTYSEPTLMLEFASDCGWLAHENNLKNILVSNGYFGRNTRDQIIDFTDAINMDLKSFSEQTYRRLIGGKLSAVLNNIDYIASKNILLEITTLVIPGENDSDEELSGIAKYISGINRSIPWHISRFHPSHKMRSTPPTPTETLERAFQIGKSAGLHHVYVGNFSEADLQNTECSICGNRLITRSGNSLSTSGLINDSCAQCGQTLYGRFL